MKGSKSQKQAFRAIGAVLILVAVAWLAWLDGYRQGKTVAADKLVKEIDAGMQSRQQQYKADLEAERARPASE